MTLLHLYDNTVGPPSASVPADPYEMGIRFQVTADTYVTALRWYRGATTALAHPSAISLWSDAGGGTLLQTVSPVYDSGAIGWQETGLGAPIALTTGVTYTVSISWPANQQWYWMARAGLGIPPTGLAWATNVRGYRQSTYAYPSTVDNSSPPWVDVTIDSSATSVPPPGEPATYGDVVTVVASYLDADVHDHDSDGYPALTKTDTAAIRTSVTNGLNLTGGLQALSDSLAHTLQMASDWLASGSSTIFTDLKNRVLGGSSGGGSAFYGPGGTQVAAGVETLLTRPPCDPFGAPPVPATGWALLASTTFTGPLAWAQPADLYVVSFTTLPARLGQIAVAGVNWVPRLGWWTPLNGTFAEQRVFIDFADAHLWNGRHLNGLLLWCEPDAGGSLEAWSYTAP